MRRVQTPRWASIKSDWVAWELDKARELEKETGRDSLCPIALDPSWKNADLPAPLLMQMKRYDILDFSGWRVPDDLETQFGKLLKGLQLFYESPK